MALAASVGVLQCALQIDRHTTATTTVLTSVQSRSESARRAHCRSSDTTGTLLQLRCSALQIYGCYSHATATLQIFRKLQPHYRHTTARRVHYSTTPHYSTVGKCSAQCQFRWSYIYHFCAKTATGTHALGQHTMHNNMHTLALRGWA